MEINRKVVDIYLTFATTHQLYMSQIFDMERVGLVKIGQGNLVFADGITAQIAIDSLAVMRRLDPSKENGFFQYT